MRYHARHDTAARSGLRINMPVNLRSAEDTTQGGNAWAPARFTLPMDIENPIERIKAFRPLLYKARTEKALVLSGAVMQVLTELPTPITTAVSGGMMLGTDIAATNVPGPPIPIYMGGSLVEEVLTFAPKGGAAINFAFVSYDKRAMIGINTDNRSIPDPEVMMECINESFDEICSLGVKPTRFGCASDVVKIPL
jgi:diacylglycerol O-acyltransferase